jgi:hypothetical protein
MEGVEAASTKHISYNTQQFILQRVSCVNSLLDGHNHTALPLKQPSARAQAVTERKLREQLQFQKKKTPLQYISKYKRDTEF